MTRTRLDKRKWLLRVITWDSIMPLVLIGVPHAVHWLFPQAEKAIEVMGGLLPLTAFFVRLIIGFAHINSNQCSPWFRGCQQVCLFLGIFVLVFVDGLMIFQLNVPQADDRLMIVCMFLFVVVFFYLPCMVVAMYPGRDPVPTSQIGNWEIEC